MLNINESMWRDSAPAANLAKQANAWGSAPEMGIPRRTQFPNSNSAAEMTPNGTGNAPVAPGEAAPVAPGNRLKFMFNADELPDSLLYGGHQKIHLEDAMERLNIVSF